MHVEVIDFNELSHQEIEILLRNYQLSLTVSEALTIQNELLRRPPTLAECILWSIQSSEHCSYKSTRHHLAQFVTSGPHVILGPKEDAGIVAVAADHQGRRYGVVMSHESHNHPSQIVPYEGAATGVGGNVRDVSCMGAEVIAIADSLRFGDLNRAKTHWIHDGVVSGIAGYGNPIGVPNLAGDVYYDPAYNDNCLVTVVTLGLVREDHVIHSHAPKNAFDHVFILVGKPTDQSGFGGASFASVTLSDQKETNNKGAVQEPNAFLQRHLLKANLALFEYLRENNLIDQVGFKDLGAGGIACASVELADSAGLGAEIDLGKIPTTLPDLQPAVVLCSETQERFMWVVPKHLVPVVLKHYNETYALPKVSSGAQAAVIGRMRPDTLYVVNHQGKELVSAETAAITKGIQYQRHYHPKKIILNEPDFVPKDPMQCLLEILSHENMASRAPILERYDKQVQGRTILEAGRADAGIMQPFNDDTYPEEIRDTGIALSLDHNPRYNQIDSFWGAVNAVCESIRNVVAVGAAPIALTDCLCFGNPEKPEHMHDFVEAVRGINEASRAVRLFDYPDATLPIIAGNVSLYNESKDQAIPPSPMISCLGVMRDVKKNINLDLKSTESKLLMIGARKAECGGSLYYQIHGFLGKNLPKPGFSEFNRQIRVLHEAINQGLVLAAHDISEGGMAVALAEMSFQHEIGIDVNIPGDLPIEVLLFSETGGFVLEVRKDQYQAVQTLFEEADLSCEIIGTTTSCARLKINGVIDLEIAAAKSSWENGLRAKLG